MKYRFDQIATNSTAKKNLLMLIKNTILDLNILILSV